MEKGNIFGTLYFAKLFTSDDTIKMLHLNENKSFSFQFRKYKQCRQKDWLVAYNASLGEGQLAGRIRARRS